MITGTGFYGSNDPKIRVKALKEDKALRIGLQSHQVHSNTPTIIQNMQYEKITQHIHINTNESTHTLKWPGVTEHSPKNCNNCSSKCSQLQYTIQHGTVLNISRPLTSRQPYSSDVV